MTARDFKMPFGKAKGMTLEDIYVDDRDYFDWLVENIDREPIQSKLEECEREMNDVKIY